jgi:aminoglycoside phosphotransferase
MNVALKFVESLGEAAGPARPAGRMHSVLATPRFPSSRNVVFLLGPADSRCPTLVAKVARLAGRDDGLAKEAGNLLALQRSWPEVDCIPRLVAHGLFLGHQILLETAVPGRPMTADMVRRQYRVCVDAVLRWLLCQHDRAPADAEVSGLYSSLVEEPLSDLAAVLPEDAHVEQLLARVRSEAEILRTPGIPTVFEHGDLSAPNLMLQSNGEAGVVDWELATPRGLPASDAFFFLAFAAAARERARTPAARARALHRAFFGPNAWAREDVLRYAEAVGLPSAVLPALFLLTWSRYLACVPDRQAWAASHGGPRTRVRDLTRETYAHLWKHAVEHIDEFGCR